MHELQRILADGRTIDENPNGNDLMTIAERQFVAFTRAVTDLFGPEYAKSSAEDWLNEVASMECLPGPTSPEWRLVTVAALARLAIRMTVALRCPSSTHSAD
jgi:hypothetical protein